MLHPEEIIALSEYLKREEFQSSPYQIFAAQQVLLSEAARNSGAGSLVRLSTLLGPIFCRTPEEQHKFEELYLQWLRQRSGRPNTIPSPPTGPGPGREIPTSHWRMKVLGVALLILPILTAWFLWQDLRLRQVIGQVMAEGNSVSQATVRLGEQTATTETNGEFQFPFQAKDMPMELGVEKEEFLPNLTPIGQEIKTNRNWFYLHPLDWSDQLNIGEIVLSKEEPSPLTPEPPLPGTPEPPAPDSLQPSPAKLSLEQISTLKSPIPPWWARLDYYILGEVLAPVLLAVGWLLYRLTRRRGLKRQSSRIPPELKHVQVQAGTQHIFPSLSLRHITQQLRQTRFVESSELDVHRTIQCTMERGGLFTPVYGSKHEPGYVALIDRSTMADHQAHLAGQLVKDLARGYVVVSQFEFDEQPFMLRRVDPLHPSLKHGSGGTALATAVEVMPLEEVQAKFPARRLLCFADPMTCFDPLTGQLRPWVETLEAWEERFLLTTTPDGQWGQAERVLSRRGFQVIPLSLLGLRLFSTLLEQGSGGLGANQKRDVIGMTSFYDRMPERWLERHPPSQEFIHRLLGDLEKDFSQEKREVDAERGKQGILWLAACAAYPEIHWALTLEWGVRLFGHGPTAETLLPKLTRLVWFRHAFMPDWFRKALYDRLRGSEADRISQELSEILSAVNPKSGEGLQLRIATQPGKKAAPASPVGPIRAWFRRLGRKLKLQAMGQAAEAGSPMGNYVMLQYLSGKQGKALTPYAPKALLRFLFPKGQPWLGFRPVFLMVAAVLASGGLWWWLDPIPVPLPSPIQEVGFLPVTNEIVLRRENGRLERWGQKGQELVLLESGEEDAFTDRLGQVKMGQITVPDPTNVFNLVYQKEGQLRLTVREDGKIVAQEAAPPSQVASLHWPTDSEAFLVVAPTEVPEPLRITGLDGLRQQELAKREVEKAAAETKAKEEADRLAEAKPQADLASKKKDQNKAHGRDEAPMVLVPAGEFTMGAREDDKDAQSDEWPAHRVYLDAFYIDQFEVTTALYSKFAQETKRKLPFYWDQVDLGRHGDRPVTGITWYDARSYCNWVGKRLPTEAEWEKAARDNTTQKFPWGNQPPTFKHGNFSREAANWKKELYEVKLKPVGSFPLGRSYYGIYDMGGNVWEWVQDWYDQNYYSSLTSSNPQGPIRGDGKVLRGGSWANNEKFLRTTGRMHYDPATRDATFGFRCALSAQPSQKATTKAAQRKQDLSIPEQDLFPQKADQQAQQQEVQLVEKLPSRIIGKDEAPMVLVPGGKFTMGARDDDKDARADERPAHLVYLDAFYIDQYEVTTSRYATFFEETKRDPPRYWSEKVLKEHGSKPVVGVNWEDANGYCEWAGKRLPTEAEWEKGARGTNERVYPWGNEPPNKQLANFNQCCDFKDLFKGYGVLADVGAFEGGKSPYGAYDMAGNVEEWVADWYDDILYNLRVYEKGEYRKGEATRNPSGPRKGRQKVLRGGSWGNKARGLRSSGRGSFLSSTRNDILGFRCAQDAL